MNVIRWGHPPHVMEIHRRWETPVPALSPRQGARDPHAEWKRVEIAGIDDARRAIGSGSDEMWKFRDLLASEACASVWRLSDRQVIDQVAWMLARQELVLFEQVDVHRTKYRLPLRVAAPMVSLSGALTPSELWPRPELHPAVRSSPLNDVPAFEPINEEAQAATLRLASEEAVPFYTHCTCPKPVRHAAEGEKR